MEAARNATNLNLPPMAPQRERGEVGHSTPFKNDILSTIAAALESGQIRTVSAGASAETTQTNTAQQITPAPVTPAQATPSEPIPEAQIQLSPLTQNIDIDAVAREIATRLQAQKSGTQFQIPENADEATKQLIRQMAEQLNETRQVNDELLYQKRKEERDRLTQVIRPWIEKLLPSLQGQGVNPQDKIEKFTGWLASITENPNELNAAVKDFIEVAASHAVKETGLRAQDARKLEESFQEKNQLQKELKAKEDRIKELEAQLQNKNTPAFGSTKQPIQTNVVSAAASTGMVAPPMSSLLKAPEDPYVKMFYNSNVASTMASLRGNPLDENRLKRDREWAEMQADDAKKAMLPGGMASSYRQLVSDKVLDQYKEIQTRGSGFQRRG